MCGVMSGWFYQVYFLMCATHSSIIDRKTMILFDAKLDFTAGEKDVMDCIYKSYYAILIYLEVCKYIVILDMALIKTLKVCL